MQDHSLVNGTKSKMSSNKPKKDFSKITTLIFDVDDTLYDVGNGFTAHRNSDASTQSSI